MMSLTPIRADHAPLSGPLGKLLSSFPLHQCSEVLAGKSLATADVVVVVNGVRGVSLPPAGGELFGSLGRLEPLGGNGSAS